MHGRQTLQPSLEARGSALVARLGGHWRAGQGLCRCPAHDDRSPSLSVRIGRTHLLFKCFAGCETSAVLHAIARVDATSLARGWAPPARPESPWRARRPADLWTASQALADSLAAHYLARRAIVTGSPALRYHPRTPLGRAHDLCFRPAMLTAVTDGEVLLAVQRTFLEREPARRARDIGNPRRMLGRPGRGAVRLAPAGDTLGLAEGTESALSAMELLSLPVWASLGSERLAHVAIPKRVRRLLLLPDRDRAGRLAADTARAAHACSDLVIDIVWPDQGFNDWNDVLRARVAAGGRPSVAVRACPGDQPVGREGGGAGER